MLIEISKLRRDGGTQPRVKINFDTAYEYGDEMKAGVKFPPVAAFYDGTDYWLADGFHRVEGAFSADFDQIECDVHQGTLEDAQWYSFGVNKAHGLRRTNEDKQRAVKAALAHPKADGMSDEKIARHCGVSRQTVLQYRHEIKPTCQNHTSQPRTGSDGRTINTANIGKRKEGFSGGTRVALELRPTQAVRNPDQPEQKPQWVTLGPESTAAELADYIKSRDGSTEFLSEVIALCRTEAA